MISRHNLAWLTDAGWERLLSSPGCPLELAGWRTRRLPLVGRRQEPGVAPGHACLGAPLPPAADGVKRRAAFTVAVDEIARSTPPVELSYAVAACAGAIPDAWRAPLDDLCRQLPGLRVYGSFAMQALTGEAYLTPDSDIDVLFAPRGRDELEAGLRHLEDFARRLPLDGEVLFASGDAVAWKEWAGAGDRVLAKCDGGVRLARRDELLEAWQVTTW
jgi:phosphoribosyl-dephospho-CoA transferase